MEICYIPRDQRVPVIVHEVIQETNSFIHPSGYISFIRDRPEEYHKIVSMDDKLRDEYQRISDSPAKMHVQEGDALLAFYQDKFYRGFCLRVLASEAEVWFADYGNIAHVKKTDLRTLPKDFFVPSISCLGRLNLPPTRMVHGNVESHVSESFNRKITNLDTPKADVISNGVSYSPFKICSIDIVIGAADSSFLYLLSNMSSLDWGIPFQVSPVGSGGPRKDARNGDSMTMKIERKLGATTMTSPMTTMMKSPTSIKSPTSTTNDRKSLNGQLPGSYPSSPSNPSDVESSSTVESSLTTDLSSLSLGTSTVGSSSYHDSESVGQTTDSFAKKQSHYPDTIEGCHRRIDELESRLKAVEERLSSLSFPATSAQNSCPQPNQSKSANEE